MCKSRELTRRSPKTVFTSPRMSQVRVLNPRVRVQVRVLKWRVRIRVPRKRDWSRTPGRSNLRSGLARFLTLTLRHGPRRCLPITSSMIDIRLYAYVIILCGQALKVTVSKVRGCYSSDSHRDQIVTINISVFRF
jgi:hypothetical protein